MKKDKKNEKFDKKFDKLILENKLNINSLEEIMENDVEEYKKELRLHVEELLKTKINEKELIVKKNKNGKRKDMN